jgi:hypothetical protein
MEKAQADDHVHSHWQLYLFALDESMPRSLNYSHGKNQTVQGMPASHHFGSASGRTILA